MHIPDGYLSPSTCATLYVLAASGWYAALRRIKRVLTTRAIPLISVFAAFSFVVMMFNLPLPGGTTGHAVGIAVAAIVLGPWGSILAISIALAIQALFFGDGGITTLGANCLNMAIIGSFVAYAVYRAIAANSELLSRRRVLAAAIAGYCAINVSAFVTALEFGIQPVLFHDTSGTPLYAPYSLAIAIPAMMLGHLTFAGLAEAAISAGMVAFLQKTNAGLLRGVRNLGQGPESLLPVPVVEASQKKLWWAVGLLMMLTPLGILAAGTAWGEWSAAQFDHADVHVLVPYDQFSPADVPAGLRKLSALWTAPFPNYAPGFIKSTQLGYLLSAMFGVGLLAVVSMIAKSLVRRKRQPEARA